MMKSAVDEGNGHHFAWQVQPTDDGYYVYLNVKGIYAGFDDDPDPDDPDPDPDTDDTTETDDTDDTDDTNDSTNATETVTENATTNATTNDNDNKINHEEESTMKKFYVLKTTGIHNCYSVRWCDPSQLPAAENDGYNRITRRDAIELVINERRRRRENSNFAYYADADILPFDISEADLYYGVRDNNRYFSRDGYIWERWTA